MIHEPYRSFTAESLQARVDQALAEGGQVGEVLLLQVATLNLPQFTHDAQLRKVAEDSLPRLRNNYYASDPKDKALYLAPALQAYVVQVEGEVTAAFSVIGGIDTEWAKAQELIYRIDLLGEQAQSWIHDRDERRPLQDRVFSLLSAVLVAVERHVWRSRGMIGGGGDEANGALDVELELLRRETNRTEGFLEAAARSSAQDVYMKGVFLGAGLLGALTVLAGIAFFIWGVRAAAGIALPAGGLGALISVMQRFHSGSLEVDYQAAERRLKEFGAFRPLIGGVLAMVIFGILEAGQLGAVTIPSGTGSEFAFLAVLGFVSGFNERFAQDMVSEQAGAFGTLRPTQAADRP